MVPRWSYGRRTEQPASAITGPTTAAAPLAHYHTNVHAPRYVPGMLRPRSTPFMLPLFLVILPAFQFYTTIFLVFLPSVSHTYICACVYVCACICVCMCVCVYIYTHIHFFVSVCAGFFCAPGENILRSLKISYQSVNRYCFLTGRVKPLLFYLFQTRCNFLKKKKRKISQISVAFRSSTIIFRR